MNSGWILTARYPPARILHVPFTQILQMRIPLLLLLLMATRFSFSRSIHFQPVCLAKPALPKPHPQSYPYRSLKSRPCPLWSSSFSLCLLRARTRSLSHHYSLPKSIRTRSTHESSPAVRPLSVSASSTTAEMADVESNPLLKEFYFPPFDSIEAKHVRPGIRALLKQLVCVENLLCVCVSIEFFDVYLVACVLIDFELC